MALRETLLLGGKEVTTPEDLDPMPQDLLELVMNESEAWARESLHKMIIERYERTKDWDKVRAALAIQLQTDQTLT